MKLVTKEETVIVNKGETVTKKTNMDAGSLGYGIATLQGFDVKLSDGEKFKELAVKVSTVDISVDSIEYSVYYTFEDGSGSHHGQAEVNVALIAQALPS